VSRAAASAAEPLVRVGTIATRVEPIGLALSPDGATLAVASGWGHALELFSMATRSRTAIAELGREPRAVAIGSDGRRAVVTHAVGSQVSLVELATGRVEASTFGAAEAAERLAASQAGAFRRRCQPEPGEILPMNQHFSIAQLDIDGSERFFLPGAFVDPGDVKVEPVQAGYGRGPSFVGCASSLESGIAVIDRRGGIIADTSIPHALRGATTGIWPGETRCLLPRAAAIDADRRTLLVACVGSDWVIEYDARGNPIDDVRHRWRVPSGPVGLATWSDQKFAVWSSFERILTVIDRKDDTFVVMSAEQARAATDYEIGRYLFHRTNDHRISRDGRACATCHPDGRDDGVTWSGPEGARQTPMLAGRLGDTAPFGWSGNSASVGRHLRHTLARLGGTGLDANATRALLTYVGALTPPPVAPPDGGPEGEKIERGRALFASAETGCAGCHRPETGFTDGRRHDIGSLSRDDRVAKLDTPSLRYLAGTAPYFHDGRYASLRGLLEATDGTMGTTGQLAPSELDALIAYLETL
jgi:mono/diheme cytochrome c family protein